MPPPFLLFLVDFLFVGGFPVSYFFGFGGFPISLFSLSFPFSGWCVLFFPFPPDPPDVHEAQGGNSHPLSSARSWRRGALGLGGIEISRGSRSVQPVFRRACV